MRRVILLVAILVLLSPTAAFAKSTRGVVNVVTTKKARTVARVSARGAAFIDKDCKDFLTQSSAQAFYVQAGGPNIDPHDLDRDHDGVACEALL